MLNPADLARRNIAAGELITVDSRRGTLTLVAEADAGVAPGQAFLPMHWGSRYLSGAGANALTLPVIDPRSFQPELKHSAIRIDKAVLPWRLMAVGTPTDGNALALLSRIQTLIPDFEFASCTLTPDANGVLLRAASAKPPCAKTLEKIHALFELDGATVLRYADPRRGVTRAVRLTDGQVSGACLSGDAIGEIWLREFHAQGLNVAALGSRLLAPTATAPAALAARGRIVCSCHVVGETTILAALQAADGDAGSKLATVQQQLRCGTQCGSCLPELRKLATASVMAA
jgi:assimilatory nitrate reductase catalytic subunit